MEKFIHSMICNHISKYWPEVVFLTDHSGIRLTKNQAIKIKKLKSGRGIPDLLVLHPSGGFHGLVMEIKTDTAPIYRKDGTIRAGQHLFEQLETLTKLRRLGYAAYFVRGVGGGVTLFEKYIRGRIQPNDVDGNTFVWHDCTDPGLISLY